MLKFIFVILCISPAISLPAQTGKTALDFTFQGTISGKKNGVLYLSYVTESGNFIEQKVPINNGKFIFKGKLYEPTHAFLKAAGNPDYNSNDLNFTELFIEPGTMQGRFTWNFFKQAMVTGSRSQTVFDSITKMQRFIAGERDRLITRSNKMQALMADGMQNENLREQNRILQLHIYNKNLQLHHLITSFITKHPDSYISPYLLFYNQPLISSDSLRLLYDSWTIQIQKSYWGKKIRTVISGLPGSVAPDFMVTDINGEATALTAINKNKVVLIDFWATWCVPCRAGNKHLIELYQMYHSKGFDIISVADDDTNIAIWKKAIQHDGTGAWHQVLKGAGTKNDIGIKYSVVSYPTKILMDSNGKIILREEGSNDAALDKKLEQLFGE